jgi:hypothetical protein
MENQYAAARSFQYGKNMRKYELRPSLPAIHEAMSLTDRHVRRTGAFILESNLPKTWQELRTWNEIGCLCVLAMPLGVLAAALPPQVELTFSRAQVASQGGACGRD